MSQQDFWGQFEGSVDGSAEAANVEQTGFDSINGGTFAPAMATEIKLTDNQAAIDAAITGGWTAPALEKFYNVKWKIIGGDYKDRIVFQKIRPFGQDRKKATRQANVLRRLMLLTGCQIGAGAPTEVELAAALNKPLFIGIALWENKNERTGEWSNGNWISHINPAEAGMEPVTGTIVPKHEAGSVDPDPMQQAASPAGAATPQGGATAADPTIGW